MPQYFFPLPSVSTNNLHITQRADLPLRINCDNSEVNPNPPSCNDSCNPALCMPFIFEADSYYNQFYLPTPANLGQATFYSNNGAILLIVPFDPLPTLTEKGWLHTVNIAFPNLDCFYLGIVISSTAPNLPPQPIPVSVQHFTPFYCKVICESTITIEGVYNLSDCGGFDYASGYRNILRIWGEFNKKGFVYEETLNAKGTRIKSISRAKYRLTGVNISGRVASQIGRIFGGKTLKINGNDYEQPSQIEKNIEVGFGWALDLEILDLPCNINFNCR